MKPPMQIDEVPQALRRWTPVASELAFPEEQGCDGTPEKLESMRTRAPEAYGERPDPSVLRWYRELYEFF